MTPDFLSLDGVGQAELVRRGELSAVELIEATISNIERLNTDLGFMASDCFEHAREVARRSLPEGPFAGVGLLIKDVIPFVGTKLEFGCRLFAGQLSQEDSPYARAIRGAGFIALGKTTTSELGLLGSTESLLNGRTFNPWDRTRSAGGSSGGAAVAVAARAVPLAHGSDGGGSIRVPSSFNGVFGLKPSRGRTWPSSSMAGPMTALLSDQALTGTVRDSAAFLAVTENPRPAAPLTPVGHVAEGHQRPLRAARVVRTSTGDLPSSSVQAALDDAVVLLETLGHEVREVDPPAVDGMAVSDAFFTLAGSVVSGLESMIGMRLDDQVVEPFTLALRDWYRALPATAMETASRKLQAVAAEAVSFHGDYDVVLTPTTPIEPPILGYLAPDLPRETILDRMRTMAGYTAVHNMAGLPAMSVPLFWTEAGLPIGTHFSAGVGQEALLLQLAYQLEQARPWRDRTP